MPQLSPADGLADPAGEAVPDDKLSAGQLDKDRLLARIKGWWRKDEPAAARWRKQAEEDFAFEAGHQWRATDEQILRDQGRPVVTFNRIAPIVDIVVGTEINSREEISAKPRGKGDETKAVTATDLIEYVRDQSDVEDEETEAFRDVVISGMSWVEHRLRNEAEPQILIERVDGAEMRWDAAARRRNLTDAKRIHRARDLAIEDARVLFPGVEDDELDAAWARGEDADGEPVDRDLAKEYASGDEIDEEDGRRGRVTIVETQWEEVASFTPVTDLQTGEREELRTEDALTAVERGLGLGLMLQPGPAVIRRVYHRAFVGRHVLESGPLPVQGEGYSYKVITGKWDRKDRLFYGIVRSAKAPQEWANKWLSQYQYRLNMGVRRQTWFESGAFVDQRKAEGDITKPGSFIEFEQGALTGGRVQRQDEPDMPDGTERLLQFAISTIRDVTGVSLELMGMAERDQPGILEAQRKQAGITILATFFDNLRRFRKASGRMTLRYAIELLPRPVLLRALGEEREAELDALMAPGVAGYDIVVEEAPTSANARERAWAAIQPMLPLILEKASPRVIAEILRASPLPPQLSEALATEIMAPPDPQAQAEEAQAKALMKATAEADLHEKHAKADQAASAAALNIAKIGPMQAEAAITIAQALMPPGGAAPAMPPQSPQFPN